MTKKGIVSTALVAEVSRTGISQTIFGWTLTVEMLIRVYTSSSAEWIGCYQRLSSAAARRTARLINQQQPWSALKPPEIVHEGEVLPRRRPSRNRRALTSSQAQMEVTA